MIRRLEPRGDPARPAAPFGDASPGNAPAGTDGRATAGRPDAQRSATEASDPAPARTLLAATLARLSKRVSLFAFRGFLDPLHALSLGGADDDVATDATWTLRVHAPTPFHRDWVRDHYVAELGHEATALAGRPVQVVVLHDPALVQTVAAERAALGSDDTDAGLDAVTRTSNATGTGSGNGTGNGMGSARADAGAATTPPAQVVPFRHRAQPSTETARPARLNPKYTFDTFVTGPSNRMAFSACTAVAEHPGARYTPLFLFGSTGLGKTHLLQAIGNEVLARHPHLRVVSMSAEQWVNEYITEIHNRRFDEFRRRYREGCDVLLIDDIQFLAGKSASQDEFFHTFNALYEAHKQIIVTSDRYPHEIAGLEERLKTRLQWGLVADVQPPELETRIAILEQKAVNLGCAVPLDVAEYLATHITSSIRELEGALVRLTAFSQLTREPITLLQTKEQLRPVLLAKTAEVSVVRVIDVVAAYYGMRPVDLKGPSRQRQVTRARQVAMWLARQNLGMSLPEIGRAFGGRDHTTVLASVQKIEGLKGSDAGVQAVVVRLTQSLFGG